VGAGAVVAAGVCVVAGAGAGASEPHAAVPSASARTITAKAADEDFISMFSP
jgi:hypothetical protein